MARFKDYVDPYALSMTDSVITVNGQVFKKISNIKLNQTLTEGIVYGTSRLPQGRTRGLVGLGQGSVTFSDFDTACNFLHSLNPTIPGEDITTTLFDLSYTLLRSDGIPRSIELTGCRITGVSLDHSADGQAATMVQPFSFMTIQVDRLGLALSPIEFVKNLGAIGSQVAKLL